jgi:hypothetical protein
VIGQQTALRELRQSSRIARTFSNITDKSIEAATDEVSSGEFGAGAGDPFGREASGEDEDEEGSKKN